MDTATASAPPVVVALSETFDMEVSPIVRIGDRCCSHVSWFDCVGDVVGLGSSFDCRIGNIKA